MWENIQFNWTKWEVNKAEYPSKVVIIDKPLMWKPCRKPFITVLYKNVYWNLNRYVKYLLS